MGLSLRPSTFSQGGLIDDIDAEIVRARFVIYDYDGKADRPALCVLLQLKDSEGQEHAQYYSAGDPAYFVPSEDPKNEELNGITLVQVGDKTSLNGGTNAALMLNSLVQAGFPEDKLDAGDLRAIEGLNAHFNRVPQPKRSGLPKKPGQEGKGDPMVLLITEINSLPGEQKAKPSSGGKTSPATSKSQAASTPPSNVSAGGDDLVGELTSELIGLFAAEGATSLKKVEIAKKLFSSIDKSNPNRNKMVGMASRDEVLKSLEGFTYNGSVLTQNQ